MDKPGKRSLMMVSTSKACKLDLGIAFHLLGDLPTTVETVVAVASKRGTVVAVSATVTWSMAPRSNGGPTDPWSKVDGSVAQWRGQVLLDPNTAVGSPSTDRISACQVLGKVRRACRGEWPRLVLRRGCGKHHQCKGASECSCCWGGPMCCTLKTCMRDALDR